MSSQDYPSRSTRIKGVNEVREFDISYRGFIRECILTINVVPDKERQCGTVLYLRAIRDLRILMICNFVPVYCPSAPAAFLVVSSE